MYVVATFGIFLAEHVTNLWNRLPVDQIELKVFKHSVIFIHLPCLMQ